MRGSGALAGLTGVLVGALVSLIAVGGAAARLDGETPATPAQAERIELPPLAVETAALPRLRARLDVLSADGRILGVVLLAHGERL